MVDFGDLQVFEGVTTYPAVLTIRRGVAPPGHALRFWKLESLPTQNFGATFSKHAAAYPQASLTGGSWELESAALAALRDKIRTGRTTLRDVYGAPLYGIKTARRGKVLVSLDGSIKVGDSLIEDSNFAYL